MTERSRQSVLDVGSDNLFVSRTATWIAAPPNSGLQ
jgi:hypothetical protein